MVSSASPVAFATKLLLICLVLTQEKSLPAESRTPAAPPQLALAVIDVDLHAVATRNPLVVDPTPKTIAAVLDVDQQDCPML